MIMRSGSLIEVS